MIRFNSFRAKDPVLAAIISMGLVFAGPGLVKAQSNSGQQGWEEVGPAGNAAQQQLMSGPPKLAGNSRQSYRPPVEAPSRESIEQKSQNEVYVVQAGDTLPKIAMKVYGDPNRWQDLMVINNIENGNRIFVGQKLKTASADSNVAADNNQMASAQSSEEERVIPDHEIDECPSPSISADAAEADASFYGQTGGEYIVQSGDTLGAIAKRILGSSRRWREIARANPNVNPNRLMVGQTLVIPGANPTGGSATPSEIQPVVSQPLSGNGSSSNYRNTATHTPQTHYQMTEPQNMTAAAPRDVSDPSFDPPPLMAPPPPPSSNEPYGTPAPQGADSYAPPAAPPVYSSGTMTPPPPPQVQNDYSSQSGYQQGANNEYSISAPPPPPPVGAPDDMSAPPAPYMSGSGSSPDAGPASPVAVSTRELYREERYRIPDELKPTDFSPYFANFNGYHGLFQVESALLPYIPTWNFGMHLRYRSYQYLFGDENAIEGNETVIPLHLSYAGKKLFAAVNVPFQSWEVKNSTINNNKVSLSGLHDPSVKVGYQVWKNLEGTHAVTLHAEGKFSGGNNHQPFANLSGKSEDGSLVGPAGSSRGSWIEVGGAYSGVMNDRWNSHINLAMANNAEDSISKFILRAGMDYRVNHNFAIVGELNSTSYSWDIDASDAQLIQNNGLITNNYVTNNAPDDTNVDLLLGFVLFNDAWQGSLGFPIALEKDWGFAHDYGVVFGLNHRWD